MMKRIGIALVLCLSMLLSGHTVSAKRVKEIPAKGKPSSVILFVNAHHFRTLKRKEVKKIKVSSLHEIRYHKNVDFSRPIIEKYPLPCKGMYVFYGTDGGVNEIYTKDTIAYYRITYCDGNGNPLQSKKRKKKKAHIFIY